MNKNNILGHQKVGFCKVSHTYLLGSLRYKEKHAKYILISCGCMWLLTNMQFSCKLVMALVLVMFIFVL